MDCLPEGHFDSFNSFYHNSLINKGSYLVYFTLNLLFCQVQSESSSIILNEAIWGLIGKNS